MTTDLTRPRSPFPYDLLPPLPAFTLESGDLVDGERMADRFTALDENISPELHWSGFPQATRSFIVSCFDPDAPTPSGWWHWTVQDLDVSVSHAWSGPYPPEGDGDHRYVFAVHALDVDTLGLDDEATPAVVAFHCSAHGIARATLTATYSRPGAPGTAPFLQESR